MLAACGGGGHSAPVHPTAGRGSAAPAVEQAPSERECDDLFAHITALVAAERNASRPDQPTSDADQHEERGVGHAKHIAECRALPRDKLACALLAPTSEAVAACDHATRSSSTSNSSVAPGGITPAAPRSP